MLCDRLPSTVLVDLGSTENLRAHKSQSMRMALALERELLLAANYLDSYHKRENLFYLAIETH